MRLTNFFGFSSQGEPVGQCRASNAAEALDALPQAECVLPETAGNNTAFLDQNGMWRNTPPNIGETVLLELERQEAQVQVNSPQTPLKEGPLWRNEISLRIANATQTRVQMHARFTRLARGAFNSGNLWEAAYSLNEARQQVMLYLGIFPRRDNFLGLANASYPKTLIQMGQRGYGRSNSQY